MPKISITTKGVKVKGGGGPFIKPPPKGLTPIGGGFYKSPDVVSPFDCQNYPDSIYCGGNPISNPLKGLPVGIGVSPTIDECGATITIKPTLGIKLPSQTYSYRKPGKCRNEYEKVDKLEPPDFDTEYQPKPIQLPQSFSANDDVIIVIAYQYYSAEIDYFGPDGYGTGTFTRKVSFENVQFPGTADAFLVDHGYTKATVSARATVSVSNAIDKIWAKNRFGQSEAINEISLINYSIHIHPSLDYEKNRFYKKRIIPDNVGGYLGNVISLHLYIGKFGDINADLAKEPYYYSYSKDGFDQYRNRAYTTKTLEIEEGQLVYARKIPDLIDPYKRNPAPDPPEPRECCMQCCQPSTQQNNNNQDLKEVLAILRRIDKNVGIFPTRATIFDVDENKQEAQSQTLEIATISQSISRIIERIEKIAKIIGIDALPLTVPDSVVDPINSNIIEAVWDWITPDKTRKINNLFEMLVWMTEQDSAVLGKWQQEITIKDADAVKEGDQEKKIAIPDLSHFCRESLMQQVTLYKTCGLILDICMKILTQGASSKQEIAKAVVAVRDIQQFLDYPVEEKLLDVPIQITPPENEAEVAYPDNATPEQIAKVDAQNKANKEQSQDLHTYLKPSHTKIKYYDWTGENSFNERLIHLASLIASRGH